jgi:thioredoxin 1
MAVFDMPITTNDQNLQKVLTQDLPIMLLFFEQDMDKPLMDALQKEAKRNAGQVLFVRMNARENPDTYRKYGQPPLPALVTLTSKRKVKSDAGTIRPADVRNHLKHLLEDTPLPAKQDKVAASDNQPIHVNENTFREVVLKSKKPVLVDFWANWCGPCHQIAPYVEQIAKQHGEKIKVVKVDVDANQALMRRYGIQSIPTLILFEGGQPADKVNGANPVALKKMVERYAL